MATFFDDFERANGAPGNSWTNAVSTAVISGGALVGTAAWLAVQSGVTSTGRQEVRAHVIQNNYQATHGGPVVKANIGAAQGFCLAIYGSSAPFYLRITNNGSASGQVYQQITLPTAPLPYYELALIYENGHLSGYYNGVLSVEADSGDYATNSYMGLAASGTYGAITDVAIVGGSAVSLSIDHPIIGNYGAACTHVVFTGTNTAWAIGSAPITASVGTFSEQAAIDATHVDATYCPGTFLGFVTFTDTTTGATCQAQVTSDPIIVPPTGGLALKLTDAGAASINTPAARYIEGPTEVLGTRTVVIPAGFMYGGTFPSDIDLVNAIANIYAAVVLQQAIPGLKGFWEVMQAINGNATMPDPPYDLYTEPLAATLKKILDRSDRTTVGQTLTLQSVIDALVAPTVDLSPILAALGLADYPLYSSLAQMVRSVRGDDVSSVLGVLSELGTIRSTHGYTLESLMDAIAGVTADVDLSPVLTAISGLRGGTATVQGVRDLLAAVDDKIDAIRTDLTAIRTAASLDLQDVLDAIAAIPAPSAGTYDGPPVWPGQASVTFGVATPLADQLVLNGPMHGVVVSVTTPPRSLGQYMVGGIRLDYGQMRIAFESDHGDLEGWQYFGFEKAIYTPHSLARAAKARLQLAGGLGGTITPWSRS